MSNDSESPSRPHFSPEALRTGIVVDAPCDLPTWYFDSPDVAVLPVSIHVGNMTYIDQHQADSTSRYLREQYGGRGVNATSHPLETDAMEQLFMERYTLDYDSVYCLTITSTRSPIHETAQKASVQMMNAARALRQAKGIHRPLNFRVIDTKNLFAAQGIPALALRDLIDKGTPTKDIRDELFKVIDATYGYLVVDDLKYMRARARLRGDRSFSLFSAVLGDALDVKPIVRGRLGTTMPVGKFRGRHESWTRLLRFTARHVQEGLIVPHVVVSYGGNLEDVRRMPAYAELSIACADKSVALHLCQMSISGMVHMGTEALCVGFAAPEHVPDFEKHPG